MVGVLGEALPEREVVDLEDVRDMGEELVGIKIELEVLATHD